MKKQYTEEQQKRYRAEQLKRKQEKIKAEFSYLNEIDQFHHRAEFIKAQAKEICHYMERLHLAPFKGLESTFKQVVEDPKFMNKYYLRFNSYGQLEPDNERIEALIFDSITPEQLAKEMVSKNRSGD